MPLCWWLVVWLLAQGKDRNIQIMIGTLAATMNRPGKWPRVYLVEHRRIGLYWKHWRTMDGVYRRLIREVSSWILIIAWWR